MNRRLTFLMLCVFVITSFIGCNDDDGFGDVDSISTIQLVCAGRELCNRL